jgi:zinc protease
MKRLELMVHSAAPLMVAAVVVLLAGCQSFPTTLERVEQSAPAAVALDIREWRTDEGTRVLFVPSPTLPMIDIRMTFDAGSARDGDKPGTASLTASLIGEGAQGLSVDDIARGFEDLGVSFATDSYRDMGIIELRALTAPEFFDPAMDLFLRVVGQPTFPQESLERTRQQYLIGLARQKQVPGPQLAERLDEVLFAGHPYASPTSGNEETLPLIRREDLQAFHQRYYSAQNAVIAIVGDLEENEARALSARITAALPKGERAARLDRVAQASEAHIEHIEFDASQTHIAIAQQSIWRGHPDWVPLYVGNQILGGGGFASILMEEVRQQRGFVYGIGSGISPMASAGPFQISLQTATENADEALQLTLKLLHDFIADGPTEEQLQAAVDSITGSMPLGVAENDDIVGQLAAMAFYDMPLDYLQWFDQEVRKVTPESVRKAFEKNLNPDALTIISIGRVAPNLTPVETEEAVTAAP